MAIKKKKPTSSKATKQSRKKRKAPTITLHRLLAELSFWGTATRALLFGFVAFVVFMIASTEASTATLFDNELKSLIYTLGVFLTLDFGYVMVARAYPLMHWLDHFVLFIADLFVAFLYIAPNLVVSSDIYVRVDPLTWIVFVPILTIPIRMLLGFLFAGSRR